MFLLIEMSSVDYVNGGLINMKRMITKLIATVLTFILLVSTNIPVMAAENKTMGNSFSQTEDATMVVTSDEKYLDELASTGAKLVGSFNYNGRLPSGKVLGDVVIDQNFKRAVCIIGRSGDTRTYMTIRIGEYMQVDGYTDQQPYTMTWSSTRSAGTYQVKVGFTQSDWCHDCHIYFYDR